MPPVVGSGVPESTPPVRVTPDGRAPMLLKVGAGKPCALRVSEPALPTVKVVLFALVNDGALTTERAKDSVASLPMGFGQTSVEEAVVTEVGTSLSEKQTEVSL